MSADVAANAVVLLERIIAHGNQPVTWLQMSDGTPLLTSYRERDRQAGTEHHQMCGRVHHLSVIAGWGTYCTPRVSMLDPGTGAIKDPSGMFQVGADYPGPYYAVECGFPSQRPEPWAHGKIYWREFADDPDEPTKTVYSYVPVDLVRDLIARHNRGGRVRSADEP